MKTVICMKWGTAYGSEYVNVMYGMVKRNISGDFRVVCFTDNTEGIRGEVMCLGLPELGCEIPPEAPGKWPKQALWAKELPGLEGVVLFLDLDSVIISSIDPYFEYGDENDVITARNWTKPWLRMSQTSVFRFKIGAHSYLLDQLRANPQLMVKYRFEQNYVSSNIRGGVKFWPSGWTRHFGLHSMGAWPLRYMRAPKQPRAARIVTFPGSPKPPDAALGRWSVMSEPRSAMEHLRYAFSHRKTDKRWFRNVRRFVQPTDWIREHWRE